MAQEDYIARMIAAHQAGAAEAQQARKLQQDQEDRQYQIELQKHNLKALQLADKAKAREEAIQNVGLTAGGVAPSYTQQPAQTGPLPTSMNPGGAQPQQITNTLPPQVIPAAYGNQDTLVNPPSMQDLLNQKNREAMNALRLKQLEPFNIAPEAQHVVPSLTGGAPQIFQGAPKEDDFTLKSGTVNGQPATVKFGNKSGKAFDINTGAEVKGFQEKPPSVSEWDQYMELGPKVANGTATQAEALKFHYLKEYRLLGQQPQVVEVHTINDQGQPVTKLVPKVAGSEFAAAPTAQSQNRSDQADTVLTYADHVLSLIDKAPNSVGPIAGRLARGETVVGNVDPDAKALGTALGSLVALQPMLHGFRGGGQTVDHFSAVLGDQKLNSAALKASINELKVLATDIKRGKAPALDVTTPAAGAKPKTAEEYLKLIRPQ